MFSDSVKSQKSFRIAFMSFFILALSLITACSKDAVTNHTDHETVIDSSVAPNAALAIQYMGSGFNLGNTFDMQQNATNLESIKPIIDLYYNAGMKHIRIPVTWMDGFGGSTLANYTGTVNFQHARFVQLKSVIDYAIQKKMYVVINAHHEHWLKNNYNGSADFDSVFTNLWRGIATYFKDYSEYLMFEILNEPEGVFGDWNGGPTPTNAQALAYTRKIYTVGYQAIRNTGGKNAKRIIMISTNGQGNHSQIDEVYPNKGSLPGGGADSCLAIQVHTYDPWSFCGQNGSNAAWPGSTTIINSVAAVGTHARLLGVPVNYGEYGVGRETNQAERNTEVVREYYRTMRLITMNQKMSATVWDDRGWFGLITGNATSGYSFLYNIVPSYMAP